jgi:hypothetical protein
MARAETIRVEAGESIKAAVEGAADGDTVLVAAGFFSGPGNRGMEIQDKSLTIIAESGPEATTICGLLMDGLFRITGSGSETVTIRGFELYRTERQFGGAIYVRMATLLLEQCYLHDCTATNNPPGTGYGGALAVWEGAVAQVTSCTFAENTAQGYTHTPGFGTSIYTDHGASTVVEQCLFMNDVNSFATGVLHADGEIFVEYCVFSGGYPPGWNVSGSEYLEIDPGVCGSGNPYPYAPCNDSMCLPENNPWGVYIGALDVNCGPCNSPVESTSWGRIKARYLGSAD